MKLLLPILLFSICAHGQDIQEILKLKDSTRVILVSDVSPYLMQLESSVKKTAYQPPGLVWRCFWVVVPENTTGYDIDFIAKPRGVTPPPPPPTITTIDNMVSTVYTGSWVTGNTTATGWYNNTIAYSNQANAFLEFKFTGTKVELWAEVQQVNGDGGISIDGGPETIVSFKSSTKQLPVLIYTSGNLILKEHTLKLRCVGNGYVMADFYKVYK